MALTATIYNLRIDLADIDRGIYETLEICVPRHPSETIEYMFMRVVAYCPEYRDGIELTPGRRCRQRAGGARYVAAQQRQP